MVSKLGGKKRAVKHKKAPTSPAPDVTPTPPPEPVFELSEAYFQGLSDRELEKIRVFFREAPPRLRDALCTILSRFSTADQRSLFLCVLESLDDVTGLLLKVADLPPAALPEVLRLSKELGVERFTELISQDGRRAQDFIGLLSRIPSDLRALLLHECKPLPLSVVTHVMDDVLIATVMEKCKLCAQKRAKKFHTDQAFDYQHKFSRTVALNLVETTADTWSDPAWVRLLSFGPSRHGSPSSSSYDVFFDNQEVDIFKTCLPCLREVQRFVSEHGNAFEVYHTEGAPQKELLADNVQLAHRKARWWTEKGHKMLRVIGVIELFIRCRKELREMDKEEERIHRLADREKEAEARREAERAVKGAVVQRANKLDAKWLDQERRAVEHLFHMNRLYCILQEENELGTVRNAPSIRENPKSAKLAGYLQPEGIPITAERASELFGTRKPYVKNYGPDIQQWKEQAIEYEKQSNVYRSFRDEMLDGSSSKDFQLRLERWRARIKFIDERNASRIMWERQEQRKRQLVRLEKRVKAKEALDEMEAEANRRTEAGRLEKLEADRQKQLQEASEARERQLMMDEEQKQTAVDRFWGWEMWEMKKLRLRRQWAKERQQQLRAKHQLMVELRLASAK